MRMYIVFHHNISYGLLVWYVTYTSSEASSHGCRKDILPGGSGTRSGVALPVHDIHTAVDQGSGLQHAEGVISYQ